MGLRHASGIKSSKRKKGEKQGKQHRLGLLSHEKPWRYSLFFKQKSPEALVRGSLTFIYLLLSRTPSTQKVPGHHARCQGSFYNFHSKLHAQTHFFWVHQRSPRHHDPRFAACKNLVKSTKLGVYRPLGFSMIASVKQIVSAPMSQLHPAIYQCTGMYLA
jgi:hypothetical protein